MCVFCEIVKGNIPCYKVYEDEHTLAFLDLSQATIGHTLVVPKKHFANLLEIDEENLGYVMNTVKKVTALLCDKLGAKGVNIINNCNEIAGQTVMHFHVHILPRYEENEFEMKTKNHELSKEEFNDLLNKLK